MNPSKKNLENWQLISSIVSSIAIPVVLAIAGYFIQKQLADEGLKKDYVSIAANILKENPKNQEPELRKWAVSMLDSNSPIPFPNKAKLSLEKGVYYLGIAPPETPKAPKECMGAPKKEKIRPYIESLVKKGVPSDIQQIGKDYDTLIVLALEAEHEATVDRAALDCLQKYSRLVSKWSDETAELYAKPIQD